MWCGFVRANKAKHGDVQTEFGVCSVVRCVRSINGGTAIAAEDYGSPLEWSLNCFVKITEGFEETSNNNKS